MVIWGEKVTRKEEKVGNKVVVLNSSFCRLLFFSGFFGSFDGWNRCCGF